MASLPWLKWRLNYDWSLPPSITFDYPKVGLRDIRMISPVDDKVIKEFGQQWNYFSEYSGHFSSKKLLADMMGPLMGLGDLKGAAIAEIGSGNGRIVNMLIEGGTSKVLGLEPSDAVRALRKNVEPYGEQVEIVQATGNQLPARNFDYVFCIGVIRHVSDPLSVFRAAREALKPGGKYFMWLYAKEGTEKYRALVMSVRAVVKRLPVAVLARLSWALMVGLTGYIHLCKLFPQIPLSKYATEVMGKVSPETRAITIYDQLDPTWVRYYSKFEVKKMIIGAGFFDVKTHHRHGYSWCVLGTVAPEK